MQVILDHQITKKMRKIYQAGMTLLFSAIAVTAQAQNKVIPDSISQSKKSKMEVILIDRFVIPTAAKSEFLERANINRKFIKTLPGFLGDNVYEEYNGTELRIVTVATWASEEAFQNARASVTEYYKLQGFDMPALIKRLHIQMERGIYKRLVE
jgi:heme-degrading monooxygenase HmoA